MHPQIPRGLLSDYFQCIGYFMNASGIQVIAFVYVAGVIDIDLFQYFYFFCGAKLTGLVTRCIDPAFFDNFLSYFLIGVQVVGPDILCQGGSFLFFRLRKTLEVVVVSCFEQRRRHRYVVCTRHLLNPKKLKAKHRLTIFTKK